MTPLMMAAQAGKKAMVELLLAHGADTKLRDRTGKTALAHARTCPIGPQTEIMAILKKAGADR